MNGTKGDPTDACLGLTTFAEQITCTAYVHSFTCRRDRVSGAPVPLCFIGSLAHEAWRELDTPVRILAQGGKRGACRAAWGEQCARGGLIIHTRYGVVSSGASALKPTPTTRTSLTTSPPLPLFFPLPLLPAPPSYAADIFVWPALVFVIVAMLFLWMARVTYHVKTFLLLKCKPASVKGEEGKGRTV